MKSVKKVYISVDMEGTEGVASKLGIIRGSGDFAVVRKRLAEDVNAAIRACFDKGAEEVVVCDGHADGENILIEDLDVRAKLISGSIRTSLQLECIQRGFDALISFGHAGAGVDMAGILDHCYFGKKIYNMRLNGITMNTETVQNAYISGGYGVPLIAIVGDNAVCNQVAQYVPNVEQIIVKEALGRFCALSLHPEKARELIYNGVTSAIENIEKIEIVKLLEPISLEIDYKETNMAETAALIPSVERLAPRTVKYTGTLENIVKMQNLLIFRLLDEL